MSRTSARTAPTRSRSATGGAETTAILYGPRPNGPVRHPTISADGRFVAFTRSIDGPTATVVALYERASGDEVEIPRLPREYFFADQPSLSARRAVPRCAAQGTETTEILLLDREAGAWEVVSVDVDNRPIGSRTGAAAQPSVSGDGRFVAFTAGSARIQLVDGVKGTDERQVYLRDRVAGRTILVSAAPNGQASNGPALTPAVDDDAGVVAFASGANDLVEGVGESAGPGLRVDGGDGRGRADLALSRRSTRR